METSSLTDIAEKEVEQGSKKEETIFVINERKFSNIDEQAYFQFGRTSLSQHNVF